MSLLDFPKDAQKEVLKIMKEENKSLLSAETAYIFRMLNKLKNKKVVK